MYTMLYIIYVADSRVLVKEVHDRSLFSGCVKRLWLLFTVNTRDRKDIESHLTDKIDSKRPGGMNEKL